MTTWTARDMPTQSGRVAFVTGATSGLGLEVATVLAAGGARVLMAYRSRERAGEAFARVAAAASGPQPELVELDLMRLESVAAAASSVRELTGDRLDLLVSNAGVMAPPLELSADGYESQWATNAIGMAALAWGLVPAIRDVPGARVTTVTSIAHYGGAFDPESVAGELRGAKYRPVQVYCHTKLTDLVFARELQRRFAASGSRALSVAAHPGIAETNIAANPTKRLSGAAQGAAIRAYNVPAQPVQIAALPLLFASTFPRMRGGYLIGPRGPFALRGLPTGYPGSRLSRDEQFAGRVWRMLAEATGMTPPL